MEHIISDERLRHINRKAYEAGKGGAQVYTQVGADGPEVVRCRDCRHYVADDGTTPWCCYMDQPHGFTPDPDGFCAWAERRDV